MFASKTLTEHLLRGLLGIGLTAAGLRGAEMTAWAWLLLPLGLLMFRGCPTCWTIGLIETIYMRLTGRHLDKDCRDGSCRLKVSRLE
ncbi:MAG: hypothetical protein ABI605_20690 [Rhizobacter sp.]